MRDFPFRVLFLCIFLPPVCYILTLQALEGYLQKRESSRLGRIMIRNHEALYEGRYRVGDEINRNLEEYFRNSILYPLGVRVNVLAQTRDHLILYPTQMRKEPEYSTGSSFPRVPVEPLNYVELASENYSIINDGLLVSVDVQIKHNTWLSNGILVFYVLLSALIFRGFVRRIIRKAEGEEREQRELIDRLTNQLMEAESGLEEIKAKEAQYRGSIDQLAEAKGSLAKDVEGLLEEMERLESGLEEQKMLKEKSEQDVLIIKEELEQLKAKQAKPRPKRKKAENTSRRFRVLYKNLILTERAIEGFLDLTEEFQLKAEEVIHRLNDDESSVTIRRKVFGKGGKMNVLEADFSYSGRIYYQKDTQGKTKIMTIGTKNTQDKDLAYLESVK